MTKDQDDTRGRSLMDARSAFELYEKWRRRFPQAPRSGSAEHRRNLLELADNFDAFVFDSFGVLNVGEEPIAGAPACIWELRRLGKKVIVLTNAATSPLASLPAKYDRLGFDFTMEEIVSSRAVLASNLPKNGSDAPWLIVAPEESKIAELDVPTLPLTTESDLPGESQGLMFLSSSTIDDALFDRVRHLLRENPQPLLIGNPDLIAPRVTGFSIEPGYYAHKLADELGLEPQFFGKPYPNAFDAVSVRLGLSIQRSRTAMIGDTLHTDVLGGLAAGFGTVLVTGHGVLKELDVPASIAESGISPDFIIPSI